MNKTKDAVLDEKRRRLVLAAQQASCMASLDAKASPDSDDTVSDIVDDGRERYDDMRVRMVALGAKMLGRYPVRTVLMVMKSYVGLSRAHIARLYGCSVETVRKALVAARKTVEQFYVGVRHG